MFVKYISEAVFRSREGLPLWYSGFLDIRQQVLAEAQLSKLKWVHYFFCGGAQEAERKVLVLFFKEKPPEVDISCLKVSFSNFHSLTHRDFLGALMSLGIKRNVLGDIFVQNNVAYIFVKKAVESFILQEFTSVGKASTTITKVLCPTGNFLLGRELITINVVNLRLDAIVSNLLHISRKQATEMIEGKNIYVNAEEIKQPAFALFERDIFSIKGYGKFLLKSIDGQSKKGRYFISIEKYK